MAVVITELPYQVNKTTLIEKMADLVGAKKLTDVSDIRDESDRDGMRIVVEVKRDGSPHTVMPSCSSTPPWSRASRPTCSPSSTASRRPWASSGCSSSTSPIARTSSGAGPSSTSQGPGAGAHPRGTEDRPRPPRRGHRHHPRGGGRRRRARGAHQAVQAQRGPGQRHPRDAAPPPGGLERKKIEDEYEEVIRLIAQLEDLLANPRKILQVIKDELAELRRKYGEERRTRIWDDATGRALRRGPHHRRGRGGDPLPARLHQAPADPHLPLPAARREGQAGDDHPRGGCGPLPPGGEHPRQHPVLHQPGSGVHHQGPRHARGQPPRQGPPDHEPAGGPGRQRRVRQRDHRPAALRARALPRDGDTRRGRSRRPPSPTTRRSRPMA